MVMPDNALTLDPQTRDRMVEMKVTCPFLGSLVHQDLLAVREAPDNPLAAIDDVRLRGNEGASDLGDLLVFFAEGNHAFMRGSSGLALDAPVPAGLFSLELPGSQGSHPGHSGILQGDPKTLASGRLRQADFDRLAAFATDGFLKRSEVGRFIAQNLRRDPNAKVAQATVAELLAHDLAGAVAAISAKVVSMISAIGTGTNRSSNGAVEQKLTRLLGEDNLVGSSGEFGLLFAFLSNAPATKQLNGEPALSLDHVRAMFISKELPEGWKTWKKSRVDWVVHTTALLVSAAKEYHRLAPK
jgi:hypothetical protein